MTAPISLPAGDPPVSRPAGPITLEPAESIALTVGWAQVQRGESPSPNVAIVCVAALARLAGRDGA